MADLTISPVELSAECSETITKVNKIWNKVIAPGSVTVSEVLKHFNELDIITQNMNSKASLLAAVSPDAGVRGAAQNCTLSLGALSTSQPARDILETLEPIRNTTAATALDNRRFQQIILDLSTEIEKKSAADLQARLLELQLRYTENLANDIRYIVTGPESLSGLSAEFVAAHTGTDGQVRISTNHAEMSNVMAYAEHSEVRRAMFEAHSNRGVPVNVAILDEILKLRCEMAGKAKMNSWAHLAMQNLMLRDPETALKFCEEVLSATAEGFQKELALINATKQRIEGSGEPLQGWDISYYLQKLRDFVTNSGNTTADPFRIENHLTYASVKRGVLWAAQQMFRVRFRKVQVPSWHADVEVFDVFWREEERGSERIGRFYLDMFSRETKYQHAGQFNIRQGVKGKQVPEAALVCNFPATGPFGLDSARTFFHEFGHLMHSIMGGQAMKYHRFSGISTEWDFVEAPSSMLENFILEPQILARMAATPIPQEAVNQLRAISGIGRHYWLHFQAVAAIFSLRLHMTDPKDEASECFVNSTAILEEVLQKYSGSLLSAQHLNANFDHLIGYTAVYYTYVWSKAIAQHIFQVFTRATDLLDPTVLLEYRDLVLAPGGTRPADLLVYDFTHQPINSAALVAWVNEFNLESISGVTEEDRNVTPEPMSNKIS